MEFKAEKGIQKQADFLVVYGNPGLGKSTFASGAPKPIFIDPRNRTRHLNVDRVNPKTWEEYLEMVKWTITQPYETIVLDEMNFVDQLAQDFVWRKHYSKYESFALAKEKGGQYNILNELYKTALLPLFDEIRTANKNLVVVAHPEVKDFADPSTAETYIRYQLGLTNGLNAMLKRSCDALIFINKDVSVTTGENKRAVAGDEIYMFCQYHQAYDAKNSWDLPAKIELKKNVNNWNVFQSLKMVESVSGLLAQIENFIPMFPADKQAEIRIALKDADLAKLQRILKNLREAV
jgi:hypothetical protein